MYLELLDFDSRTVKTYVHSLQALARGIILFLAVGHCFDIVKSQLHENGREEKSEQDRYDYERRDRYRDFDGCNSEETCERKYGYEMRP